MGRCQLGKPCFPRSATVASKPFHNLTVLVNNSETTRPKGRVKTMKTIIPAILTILLLLAANSAMADRGYNRGGHSGYSSQGERIEQHLGAKGDRIEHHFDRKAERAYEQGKYRQARHFQHKGDQINRHLGRKGERIHDRFEHRGDYRQEIHHYYQPYPRVGYPAYGQRLHDSYVSVRIQQPGLWLGWGMHR